jgi:hypothetical protein
MEMIPTHWYHIKGFGINNNNKCNHGMGEATTKSVKRKRHGEFNVKYNQNILTDEMNA